MDLVRDYLSSCVISDGKVLDDYSKIYFKTNEDLVCLYETIDFQGRDVFTVLGSSDQVFMATSCGASRVDSFDKNPLAIYYYYLRCWTIKYSSEFYPEPILDNNYRWLRNLLRMVEPQNEEEKKVLDFWKRHLKRRSKIDRLFFEDNIQGYVSFSEDVIPEDINFSVVNMFQENDFDSSYDIVILSNIIEWARGNNRRITCIRDNLEKLLKKDGIVLCSEIIHRYPEKIGEEREIFTSSFDFLDYGNNRYAYQKR